MAQGGAAQARDGGNEQGVRIGLSAVVIALRAGQAVVLTTHAADGAPALPFDLAHNANGLTDRVDAGTGALDPGLLQCAGFIDAEQERRAWPQPAQPGSFCTVQPYAPRK